MDDSLCVQQSVSVARDAETFNVCSTHRYGGRCATLCRDLPQTRAAGSMRSKYNTAAVRRPRYRGNSRTVEGKASRFPAGDVHNVEVRYPWAGEPDKCQAASVR